jgi:dTMP kinase
MPYVPLEELRGKLIVLEGTDGVGRTTQVVLLREWLEVQGFSVVETGWTRSRLVGPAITRAKRGHALNPLTFALMYACDFAERLEGEILPALRAGSIVLSDRYIYTAFARNEARGLSVDWVRSLFGFALVPDLVFYLEADLNTLVPRVLRARRLNYWEAGVDLALGGDLYDCFLRYQERLLGSYRRMKEEYGFVMLDARQPPERIQSRMREEVERRLSTRRRNGHAHQDAQAAGAQGGDQAPGGPPSLER